MRFLSFLFDNNMMKLDSVIIYGFNDKLPISFSKFQRVMADIELVVTESLLVLMFWCFE